MPVITAIKRQIKRENRFSIYLDGKYNFSLFENELMQLRLHEGDSISEKALKEFHFASKCGKLYDQVLRLIMVRPRSEREILLYFRKKQPETDVQEAVMDRLKTEKRINDKAFAQWWIQQRREFKLRSQRALAAELAQKGIASEVVDELLRESGGKNEIALLKELIIKKQRLGRYGDPQKLMAYLARQGFAYSDIKQALAEIRRVD